MINKASRDLKHPGKLVSVLSLSLPVLNVPSSTRLSLPSQNKMEDCGEMSPALPLSHGPTPSQTALQHTQLMLTGSQLAGVRQTYLRLHALRFYAACCACDAL